MLKGEETTFKITESAFLRDLYTTLTFQCKVGLGIISLPKMYILVIQCCYNV
jgi:hypothetical protein